MLAAIPASRADLHESPHARRRLHARRARLGAGRAGAGTSRPAPGGGGGRRRGPEGGSSGALPQLAPCLHVSGLTLENAEKVSDDLEALENTSTSARPATAWTVLSGRHLLDKPREGARASPGQRRAQPQRVHAVFVVAHGRSVRLTELEHALAADHIEVLRDRLHLTAA
jgi:hypothetical protein